MCEQTEVQYLEGNVVWVKLGSCWWPGEVQDVTKLPEEVREDLREDLIAAVKFFDEDKYEYVHKLDHICMYNCRRKMEFIKRGLDMYRTKKKEGSAFMDKFPADVEKAESMTGGDPQILSDSEFAPKEKTTWKTIFCEDKKPVSLTEWFPKPAKMNKNSAATPEVQSHKPAVRRRITHPRLLRILRGEEADHEVRIRPQPSANNSAPEKSAPYHCPTCEFTSNRLNVIILHNKYHSNMPQANRGRGKGKVSLKADISVGSPAGRGMAKGRMKQSQSNIPTDGLQEKDYHSDSEPPIKIPRTKDKVIKKDRSPDNSACDKLNERTEPQADKPSEKKSERKPIFGKRKGSKKKEIPPKKKKTNEEIREKLLADWEDDDDDEQEEQEIELLKQVLNKSSKTENTTRAKEMSCFDFDESADSMLDVELEERAKKFAENLRFPRVTEDRDSVQKQKSSEVKQSQSTFPVTREVDRRSQKTAEAVDNNDSPLHVERQKEIVNTDNCTESSILANENVQDIMMSSQERMSSSGTELEEKPSKAIESEDLKAAFETVMADTVIPDLPAVPENRFLSERKSVSISEPAEGSTEFLDGRDGDPVYSTNPDDSPQPKQKNENASCEQNNDKDQPVPLETEFSEAEEEKKSDTKEEKKSPGSEFESETFVEKSELPDVEVMKELPAESSEKQFQDEGNERQFQNEGSESRFQDEGTKRQFQDESSERHFQDEGSERQFQDEGSERQFQDEGSVGHFQDEGSVGQFQDGSSKRQLHDEGSEKQFQVEGSEKQIQDEGNKKQYQDEGNKKQYQDEGSKKQFQDEDCERLIQDEGSKRQFQDEGSERQFQCDGSEKLFQDECSEKQFQDECSEKQFQDECSEKQFQDEFSEKQFQEACSEKQFQDECSEKQFQDECSEKQFQDQCSEKQLQDECSEKQFQDECSEKQFQDESSEKQFQDKISNKQFQDESSEKQFQETRATDQLCHISENEDAPHATVNEESSPDKNCVLPISEDISDMHNFQPTDEREITSDINGDGKTDPENPEHIQEATEHNELLSLQIKKTADNLEGDKQCDSESKVFAELSEEEIGKPFSSPSTDNPVTDFVDKVKPNVEKDSSEMTEEKIVCDNEKIAFQETDTIDDDDELDINSMPVVMTDAVIKEELDVKDSIKQFSAIQPVVVSAANIDGQLSTASVFVPASVESGSLVAPVSSVKTTHGANTVLKIIKSSPGQGANVSGLKSVLPHKPGSKYVIIQQTPGQQVRYSGKPLQQCVTLKTINQQQGNNGSTKKLLIMKTSPSTGSSEVQSILTSSSKMASFGQRVITSSGAIVTAVPSGKTVLPKGAKIVPMPQQQLKVFTSAGKQKKIVAPKITMQSTKTKVSLPSMQSLQKVNVLQTSTGRILGTTNKTKSSTILIHSPQVTSSVQSKQGIITSSNSTQNVPQVSVKQQLVRGKQMASQGTSLQRVLLTSGTQSSLQQQQQRPLLTKPASQQRMLVQRLQVPKSATVVVSTDSIKKTSSMSTGQVSNTSKILPHTQQKGNIQAIHPKGRVLTIQNTKQKLPAKILQPVSVSQSLQSVQVLQAAVPAEAVEHPVSGSSIVVPSSAPSGTTAVNIQHSSASGSILTSEQLAQMMGTSGQIATDSGTLVLVTINEAGNLQPFDNSTLVAYDTSAAPDPKATNALYIDSSTLGSQNDLDKLIFTINNQAATTSGVVNLEQQSPSVSQDQQCAVFNITNSQTAAPGTCNQDILAAALANTNVFQAESSNVVGDSLTINHPGSPGRLLESSSLLTVSSTTLHQAAMLLPSVTTAAPGVLETSLTLNQPIMTPLEVPSAVTHLESPPPPPPSTSMQLTQSSLVIPTSAFSSVNYASETAPSTESPVSSSTVMKALPSLQLPVQYVSEEVSESSEMQDKIEGTVAPPSSSGDASQNKDKMLPSFENISEGVTSSEVAGNLCSKYSPAAEATSAQVPEISSPQENKVNFNNIQPEFQQMPESTSETLCCTKNLTNQAVSTSCATDVKDNPDGIDSSANITSSPVIFSHQAESTSEAIARRASDTAAAEEEQSQHHEDQSPMNCVESTSENMLMDDNVPNPHLAATEDAESTSGTPEETNSSSTAVVGAHQIASSMWAESGSNSETGPAKEESER